MYGHVVKILSIDGGGIRGLIPALILEEIERRLVAVGKKRPFATIFDLVAGTSTGALIALGLALPQADNAVSRGLGHGLVPALSMGDIIDLYTKRGPEVFSPDHGRKLSSTLQAFKHKYNGIGLERVLDETFGDATLQDALTNVLVTSFNSVSMQPQCLKKRPYRPEWKDDMNFYMRDAARASSAAPAFFPPALISPLPERGERLSLIDGAIFANNPSLLAYIEATKIFPEAKDFLILSLGTGDDTAGFPYAEIEKWGFIEWVNPLKRMPLLSMISAGQSESVNHMLKRIAGLRYFRFSGPLGAASPAIDDSSQTNIAALRDTARHIIDDHEEQIELLCEAL